MEGQGEVEVVLRNLVDEGDLRVLFLFSAEVLPQGFLVEGFQSLVVRLRFHSMSLRTDSLVVRV